MTSPLVIAHRGGSPGLPENSLAAFRRAIVSGADMLECDVRRAADGALVVHHDARVVLDGRSVPLATRSLAVAREAVPTMPTLAEFLEEFAARLPFNVDLKASGWEGELVAALRRHDALDRVLVSSKHLPSLRRLALIEPRLALGLSRGHLGSGAPGELGRQLAGCWLRATLPLMLAPSLPLARAGAAMLQYRAIGPRLVRLLHRRGIRVFAWTVNAPAEAVRLGGCGVDGIASDDLEPILAALTAAGCRRRGM